MRRESARGVGAKIFSKIRADFADRNDGGDCGFSSCDSPLTMAVTIRWYRWDEPELYGMCDVHARSFIDRLAIGVHYLGVEPWGTWQPALEFD